MSTVVRTRPYLSLYLCHFNIFSSVFLAQNSIYIGKIEIKRFRFTFSDEIGSLDEASVSQKGIPLQSVAVAINSPETDLLSKIVGGDATRVIHFSPWENVERLFNDWLAHVICEGIKTSKKHKTSTTTSTVPTTKKQTVQPTTTELLERTTGKRDERDYCFCYSCRFSFKYSMAITMKPVKIKGAGTINALTMEQ